MVQGMAQGARAHRSDASVKQTAQRRGWLSAQCFGQFEITPGCHVEAEESIVAFDDQRLDMRQRTGLRGLGVAQQCAGRSNRRAQAVGAKTKDILTQFLVEAVTLSVAGGIAGIALGLTVSALISYFADWSTVVSFGSILLAFVFSALVGVSFGYYPARKAAFMDPIQALHYE